MQIRIVFVLLCALFFSAFHDTVLPLVQTHDHQNIAYQNENNLQHDVDTADTCAQVHNMLHFIAIVMPQKSVTVHLDAQHAYRQIIKPHTPPLQQSTYKPPIA